VRQAEKYRRQEGRGPGIVRSLIQVSWHTHGSANIPVMPGPAWRLTQLDLVGDFVLEADAAKRQYHLRRQLLAAFQAAARDRLTHRLFNLALRGDSDLL